MTLVGWLAQPAVFPWLALIFGLCVGSFLNVVIHRLPKMMEREWRAECAALAGQEPAKEPPLNLMVPRSRCPSCARQIGALENIPLVSFALLRGRCANCKAPIGLKYPLSAPLPSLDVDAGIPLPAGSLAPGRLLPRRLADWGWRPRLPR